MSSFPLLSHSQKVGHSFSYLHILKTHINHRTRSSMETKDGGREEGGREIGREGAGGRMRGRKRGEGGR